MRKEPMLTVIMAVLSLRPTLDSLGRYVVNGSQLDDAYASNDCCGLDDACSIVVEMPARSSALWPVDTRLALHSNASLGVELAHGSRFWTKRDNGTTTRSNGGGGVQHCLCTQASPDHSNIVNPPCRPFVTLSLDGLVVKTGCELKEQCGECTSTTLLRNEPILFVEVTAERPFAANGGDAQASSVSPITDLASWESLPYVDASPYAAAIDRMAWNATNTTTWVWSPFRVTGGKFMLRIPFASLGDGMVYVPRPADEVHFKCFGCPECPKEPQRTVGKDTVTVTCMSTCTLGRTCSLKWW